MSIFEDRKTDTSIRALTPEGIEYVLFPAGLPVRTCAYGIDQLVQWTINIVLGIVTRFFRPGGGLWLYLILLFCVDWFYHFGCESFFRGQSLGKRVMGIRVLRNDGAPVDPGSSFLRNLLRFADTFLFLCPIAFISMAASRGFRRLGDWAAGTLVVYTPKSLALPRYTGLYRTPDAALSPRERIVHRPLSHEEKQAILMFARRYPLLGEARANEIARPYAAVLRDDGGPAAAAVSDSAWFLRIAEKLSGRTEDGLPGDAS
ncbi:MAG: RDD family protein [Treponema sp.]|jgi:uncharacterized RDD family membrane protein YckC|nr:RDD family protein [Treponema sp.]